MMDSCPFGCRGIFDSGAPRLGAQAHNFQSVQKSLARAAPLKGGGCHGPELESDLGSFTVKLPTKHYMAALLEWSPVLLPPGGFCKVAVKAVRLGNVTLDSCPYGCRGIIDTGASRLGLQANNFQMVQKSLARAVPPKGRGCHGPELGLDLGSFSVEFPAFDYASGAACEPLLGSLGPNRQSLARAAPP